MEIFVLTQGLAGRADSFRGYAGGRGCKVRSAPPERLPPERWQAGGGVVIFDDGRDSLAECVARVRDHVRYLGIPVVAVTPRAGPEVRSQLMAAGAGAVLEADAGDDRILAELESRSASRPILADIRERLMEPFVAATLGSIREMAATAATVRSMYQKVGYRMFGDVSAVIGLVSAVEGSMVLSFPDATAATLAGRVLAGVTPTPDEDMVRDCVGELANVVAGQAKGLLAGTPHHFAMSTPTIVSGTGHEIRHQPGMPCLVAAFGSDAGDFALQLCIKV
jgi:chemotaxis protein CheX